MELHNRHVLVVGLGRSGLAAARLCLNQGATVTLNDSRPEEAFGDHLNAFDASVERLLGGHPQERFREADLIVLSPGVPPLEALDAARDAGVPIVGEVELGARFVKAPIIAITGTNGKSTTTTLCGAMIAADRRPTFTGGNLGEPLCEALNRDDPGLHEEGACVLELSSFQLETVERFHAHVAVLLNLSEDHLDRHPSFEAYVDAKARIFERQTPDDWAIYNADPEARRCREIASRSVAPKISFRGERSRGTGAWLDNHDLCLRLPRGHVERYDRATLRIPGLHNAENALAALLAARLVGAGEDACAKALASFGGLPHRMELVGEYRDVRYYDDSKATNVGSVVGSLRGFERKVVLIAGGKDKGGDYAPLRETVQEVCRHVVLIGAAAPLIEATLRGTVPLSHAKTMNDAVRRAMEVAKAGDAVVLSPACSSYDMYENYIARGRDFAANVATLGDTA